jgi:hypothetical protein
MSNETVEYFQTKLGTDEMGLLGIESFEVINCFFICIVL